MTTEAKTCPTCGCTIDKNKFELEGIAYCCVPCATREGECQCGCCEEIVEK